MSDIQDLEQGIEDAKEVVNRRQMALKLFENYEFRKLFIEGYFLEDAARLVQMSTDPRVKPENQQACLEEARATGYMRRFLSDCVQFGAVFERDLPQMHATLAELRAEEAE
jgi:hypothetical protein